MVHMAKKRTASNEQYRKPYRPTRVRARLARQLDIVVDLNASDFTEEVNNAVREYLIRLKLWPPAGASVDDKG